ncbi:hypothetical protein KL928_003399 [Ogataea angusta]|uniref:Major facilitator superfamily (MFS) profile domain-containing protein n=1 Tax=Pichia angusta TaxID=870730 RepID=A0AAN6DF34_PICAN|nr:uncharacterized protein KL928_003399 [Ogataea angusta]KAG7818398.1 hypothetical protein KL928_003399 [Ogataea angusta]
MSSDPASAQSSSMRFIPRLRQVEDEKDSLDSSSEPVAYTYRDEANRPWWKFFDEFEYRQTSEEASRRKWYRWFPEGTSAQEVKLLCKLDILIAFYSFVGYWIKYIDSSNLNNAYVSNMKEDLGMKGNDLINTQLIFNIGNILLELPWLYLLPRVPINYSLFICELGWAAFTLGTYRVNNVGSLQAVRFFVGAFEAAYFPCIHYTLASWYKPTEVGRRGALFYAGQFLGVLTSGLLQSAAFKNLDGHHGLAGWRWMFIIDGCISFAVAILALYSLPGTPTHCYSMFLTDDEIKLARKRMKENGTDPRQEISSFFSKESWSRALKSPHVYILSIANMMGFNTNNTSAGTFTLWLKSLNIDIGKINNWSTIPPALGILYVFIICGGADLTGKRYLFIMLSFLMTFIGNVILAIWDVSYGAKWFAFCFAYWSWSQSSVFNPLVSDLFRRDNNVRAIAWMIIYIMGLQSSVWINRLIWPTVDSPRFEKGFTTCAVFSIGFILLLAVDYFFYKKEEREHAIENGIYIYNSKAGEIPEGAEKEVHVHRESISTREK